MVIYLRTPQNKSIFEAEIYNKKADEMGESDASFTELHTTVYVRDYSLFLINLAPAHKQLKFLNTMDTLSELRGWMWEIYFMTKKNRGQDKDDIIEKVRETFRAVAEEFGLNVVED